MGLIFYQQCAILSLAQALRSYRLSPKGDEPDGSGCFLNAEEAISYMMSLPRRREVIRMVAWEELFMFCTLIIQIIALIIAIFQHKKK